MKFTTAELKYRKERYDALPIVTQLISHIEELQAEFLASQAQCARMHKLLLRIREIDREYLISNGENIPGFTIDFYREFWEVTSFEIGAGDESGRPPALPVSSKGRDGG